jgi:hypothetical protein
MKKVLVTVFAVAVATTGCKKEESGGGSGKAAPLPPSEKFEPPTPSKTAPGAATPAAAPTPMKAGAGAGKVLETMNSGGYTYVRLNTGSEEVWIAAPETTVAVGDEVSYTNGMPMEGFRSNTLSKTFDLIYFVPAIQKKGGTGTAPAKGSAAPAAAVEVKGVEKAPGGVTVTEIFAGKDKLIGKEVTVRGQVVKYNGGILGRNWLHIQDGSGKAGTNDITVTSQNTTEVGKVVLVKGTLAANKDFGGGYKYDLIIENATLE